MPSLGTASLGTDAASVPDDCTDRDSYDGSAHKEEHELKRDSKVVSMQEVDKKKDAQAEDSSAPDPQMDKLASLIARSTENEPSFEERLARRAKERGIDLPGVTIAYKDINVTTGALKDTAALPTLPNAAVSQIQRVTPGLKDTTEVSVLKNVSGVLKPGRTTLLLGPPVSGKSTLLKLLAGRLKKEKGLSQSGTVRYNGRTSDEFVVERTTAYIDQEDNHEPAQTILENLHFAWKCQSDASALSSTERARLARAAAQSPADTSFLETGEVPEGGLSDEQFDVLAAAFEGTELRVDVLLKMSGLWGSRNTVVGNAMVRGVSGGERHRVTTAEMIVGRRSVLMMDEIGTGLDSATLEVVIKSLARITRCMRLTTLIALLQPPPELFECFDDVMLIAEGYVVYHGPAGDALPFLESCGFKCPEHQDRATFIEAVTSPLGQLEFATDELRARKHIPSKDSLKDVLSGKAANPHQTCPLPVQEISEAFFSRSDAGRALMEDLEGAAGRGGSASALAQRRFSQSPLAMLATVCGRSLSLSFKQLQTHVGRIIQAFVVGLMVGSLWFDLEPTQGNARNFPAVLFMSILFLATGAAAELGSITSHKPVFFKQRDNLFYAPVCYAIATVFEAVPSMAVEAIVYSVPVYFMVGFTLSASAFFTFLLLIFLQMAAFGSFMRLIAAVSHTETSASWLSSFTIFALVLFSGFSLVRDSVPPWWIWAYYLLPLHWALQGLAINEMTQVRWRDEVPGSGGLTTGQIALLAFDMETERGFIWFAVLQNLAVLVVMTGLMGAALMVIQPPRTPTVIADAEKLHKYQEEAAKKKANGAKDSTKLPFTPVTLTFIDLSYFVTNPDKDATEDMQLLHSVTGTLAPGEMCALMGGSGASKSTLMDVLTARKTVGRTTGEILLNGRPMEPHSWSRSLAYVEQMDIHSAQLTVFESLEVSARLRLPRGTTEDQIQTQVYDALQMVDMVESMNELVGTDKSVGLSVAQRKRLTIAVELVANPSAVFMDEPTSGLAARAAALVIQSVKSIAASGRTVMLVVHQPSFDIFESFHQLLLLAKGGRTVYYGPMGEKSAALVEYLSSIPDTPAIKPGANPATWMLQVTGGCAASGGPELGDKAERYVEAYNDSDLAAENRRAAEAARKGEGDTDDGDAGQEIKVRDKYAQTWATQLKVLWFKFAKMYWRNPDYNLMRFIMTVIIALVLGTSYLGLGELPEQAVLADVQNVLGVLNTSVSFMGMSGLLNVLPIVTKERSVFYRERSVRMYSAMPYAIATSSVELPYIFFQSIIYCPIVFFLVRFDNSDGWQFWYFFMMVTTMIAVYTFLGQALAYATPSPVLASVLASGLDFIFSLYNGFAIGYPEMPKGWQWLNRAIPTTWVMYGLAVSQLGSSTQDFRFTRDSAPVEVREWLRVSFGFEYSFRWQCLFIVFVYAVALRLVGAAALRFCNYQKR